MVENFTFVDFLYHNSVTCNFGSRAILLWLFSTCGRPDFVCENPTKLQPCRAYCSSYETFDHTIAILSRESNICVPGKMVKILFSQNITTSNMVQSGMGGLLNTINFTHMTLLSQKITLLPQCLLPPYLEINSSSQNTSVTSGHLRH